MKNARLFLSAFVVFAVVGSALAFNTNSTKGQGSVYCNSTCTQRVDFRADPAGEENPCTGQEYVLVSNVCTASSGPFISTLSGK